MNTGLHFEGAVLTVEVSAAKSQQTRHTPLNAEALAARKNWHEQRQDAERVFPVGWLKTAWNDVLEKAKVEKFRWHDLRHHFASRLVQGGMALNTVRELPGHGSSDDSEICALGTD
jgi:integrase